MNLGYYEATVFYKDRTFTFPCEEKPRIPARMLSKFLNSDLVDMFSIRCIEWYPDRIFKDLVTGKIIHDTTSNKPSILRFGVPNGYGGLNRISGEEVLKRLQALTSEQT